jgi:hypothetical protein
MVCCGKSQQPQYRSVFTEIRWKLRGDRKRRQSRQFYISKVKSVFISGVKSTDAGECWAATRWGRLVSAHRGDLAAPKTPIRVLFSRQRQHCPKRIPAPSRALQPARSTRDRECSCAGRGCLSAWGLVAGVGVDVSLSAVLGFLSATNPAAVKLIDAFRSHYSAPALYVCDRYRLPARH